MIISRRSLAIRVAVGEYAAARREAAKVWCEQVELVAAM